jgi:predicted ABC-type ATPase
MGQDPFADLIPDKPKAKTPAPSGVFNDLVPANLPPAPDRQPSMQGAGAKKQGSGANKQGSGVRGQGSGPSKGPSNRKADPDDAGLSVTDSILSKLVAPNIAEQVRRTTDISRPEVQQREKAAAAQRPLSDVSITLPGIGRVRMIGRGPGYVATVEGQTFKAGDPHTMAGKILAWKKNQVDQAATRAQSPNVAAYEPTDGQARPDSLSPFGDDRHGAFIVMPNGELKARSQINDRDRLAFWNDGMAKLNSKIAEGITAVTPGGFAIRTLEQIGVKVPAWAKKMTEFLPDQAATVATFPVDAIGDGMVLGSNEFSLPEKAAAVANIALKVETLGVGRAFAHDVAQQVGAEFAKAGKKFFPSYLELMRATPETAEKAFRKIGLNPDPAELPNLTPFDTPAIKKARMLQGKQTSTHTINTPERNAMRDQLTDQFYGQGAAKKEHQATIVLGMPASGKSTRMAIPAAEESGSMIIDSDMIKEHLPEFNEGKGAGAVHKESSDIADAVYYRALKNGDNIVYPLIGKNPERLTKLVAELKDSGYDVHLKYMQISPEEAAKRAVTRHAETGRFVDPHYVLNEVGTNAERTYGILRDGGGLKSYEAYNNEVPFGERPKLIEQGGEPYSSNHGAGRRGGRGHAAGDGAAEGRAGSIPEVGSDRGATGRGAETESRSAEAPSEARAGNSLTSSGPIRDAHGNVFYEERVDPKSIGVMPGIQFKKQGVHDAENAVTDALKGAQKYDQATAGPLTVWETSDGKRWVMNGHHRRELAIRTGEKDVPVRIYKEADGVTFDQARGLGALQNLKDGKGAAIDMASVLRDLGYSKEELQSFGINMKSDLFRNAHSLLGLDPEALKFVEEQGVSDKVAAGIADAKLPKNRQMAALKEAQKLGFETRRQGELLGEGARTAPISKASEADLFGEFDESLALGERTKLADSALNSLSRSERFSKLGEKLKKAGSTVIDKEAQNQQAAIYEFAQKALSTDAKAAAVLDAEAVRYAQNPTRGQLQKSIEAVADAATEAAERRLEELGVKKKAPGAPKPKSEGKPKLSPATDVQPATPGLELRWKGKTWTLTSKADEDLYDLIHKGYAREVRPLERQLATETDPVKKRRLLAEIQGKRSEIIEKKDEFFADISKKQKSAARQAAIDRGEIQDMDAEFLRRVESDDVKDIEKDVRKRLQGGYTRLPVGDLRKLVDDIGILAGKAIQAGKTFLEWSRESMVKLRTSAVDLLNAAWQRARQWYTEGVSAAEGGQLQRGGVRKSKRITPLDSPAHLETGEDAKGVKRSFGRWVFDALVNESGGTEKAVDRLSKTVGKNLQYSDLDLRAGINEQSRLGRKIEKQVMHGIRDAEGKRVSVGVPEIIEGLAGDGINPSDWQKYRRALRENELSTRGGIDPGKIEKNYDYIDRFLQRYGGENVAKWDREWQKLVDAHLDLYEQYGLKEKGWAEKIREDNSFYFPLNAVTTDPQVTMRELNPQPGLASPMGRVVRAKGGKTYTDGFSAMAASIEDVIREGEKNRSMLPFFDEVSKHENLSDIAKEINPVADKADDLANDFEPDVFGEDAPKIEGQDNVVTFLENGKKRTFEIDPYIWKTIQGSQPQEANAYLKVMKVLAGLSRSGTTGRLNPFFGFIFNPMIDIASATVLHGMNPLRFFEGLGHAAAARVGKETNLYRSAIESNVFFGSGSVRDFEEAQRMFNPANTKLFDRAMESKGVRVLRTMRDVYDAARESIEEATRLGFYSQQKTAALKKGMMLQEAEKMASQMSADLFNFAESSEAGRFLTKWGGVPYSNIVGQGIQSAARGFKRSPVKFMARGFGLLAAPAMVEYNLYHDDPEWQKFEDWQKVGAMTFRSGLFYGKPKEGDWVAIRIPAELGVIFRGIPLKVMQARENGDWQQAASEELSNIVDQYTPSFIPTIVAAGGQAAIYHETGGTMDLRFFRYRSFPYKERKDDALDDAAKAKARYQFLKQEVDTIFGSMGRYVVGKVGYKLSEDKPDSAKFEKRDPSMFQRYRPVPQEKDPAAGRGGRGAARGAREKARGGLRD